MNWKCPHCGAQVHADNNQIKPGWSFAKCHQCLGFSLVRKVEMSVIKVDRPPLNEKDVLVTYSLQPASTQTPPPFKKPETLASRPKNISSSIYIRGTLGIVALATAYLGVQFYEQAQKVNSNVAVTTTRITKTPTSEITEVKTTAPVTTAGTVMETTKQVAQLSEERAQVISTKVKLRSGPGVEYVQVGQANPNKSYKIKSRINRWVQLEIESENPALPNESQSVWVRDDLIKKVASAE